jgi:lipopolysaccharide/colanic/teichoic acid biosynthesis glycosyltransferase
MPERETPVELDAAQRMKVDSAESRTQGRSLARRGERRVLVIGAAEDLPRALAHPAVLNGRFTIVDSIGVDVEASDESSPALNDALAKVRSGEVDTLLVAGEIGPSTMRRIADIALAFHCEVLAVMPTEVLEEHEPVVVWTRDGPLIQLAKLPRHPVDGVAKRAIDIIGASLGLIVSAPIIAVLAALVVLESPGPFIFKHERVGFRGKKFNCLKLRTMRPDAEHVLRSDPAMYEQYRLNHYKLPDDRDSRVTRIGRFLRRTSLDELPQLWNVLVGDMSLVGPRPVVEDELNEYRHDRDIVLSVKPGLTGAWAVSGRQAVGYPERCDIELRYVRERNLLLDTRIILQTARVVMSPLKSHPPQKT